MEFDFIRSGQRVVDIEAAATQALHARIDASFVRACQIVMACKGRVIITGMGKSGHIGTKIAATLASTGTPAFFVHPGEASHGDLGMITGDDVVIAISNSGKTEEIVTIVPLIKRKGAPLISLTGVPTSTLATQADVNLDVAVKEEACPLGLAPTASTTATLVMGDALAVALLEARGFTANDFALSHPGGSLGRRLLLLVENIMRTGTNIPLVGDDTTVSHALLEMSSKGLGMTGIIDDKGKLAGVFTDGDLRRALDHGTDLKNTPIRDVMTKNPKTVQAHVLAVEALNLMDQKKITALMVLDSDGKPAGALNMHDLLAPAWCKEMDMDELRRRARAIKLVAFDIDGVNRRPPLLHRFRQRDQGLQRQGRPWHQAAAVHRRGNRHHHRPHVRAGKEARQRPENQQAGAGS